MVIRWHVGTIRIDNRPRWIGNTLVFGASINGEPFREFVRLTIDDPKLKIVANEAIRK